MFLFKTGLAWRALTALKNCQTKDDVVSSQIAFGFRPCLYVRAGGGVRFFNIYALCPPSFRIVVFFPGSLFDSVGKLGKDLKLWPNLVRRFGSCTTKSEKHSLSASNTSSHTDMGGNALLPRLLLGDFFWCAAILLSSGESLAVIRDDYLPATLNL